MDYSKQYISQILRKETIIHRYCLRVRFQKELMPIQWQNGESKT